MSFGGGGKCILLPLLWTDQGVLFPPVSSFYAKRTDSSFVAYEHQHYRFHFQQETCKNSSV